MYECLLTGCVYNYLTNLLIITISRFELCVMNITVEFFKKNFVQIFV